MRAEGIADVSIITEDDGAGLVPAQWPLVLERGVRVDERGDGAGLGLSIVRDCMAGSVGSGTVRRLRGTVFLFAATCRHIKFSRMLATSP